MKLKNILNGEVVNDCEDIARIMENMNIMKGKLNFLNYAIVI